MKQRSEANREIDKILASRWWCSLIERQRNVKTTNFEGKRMRIDDRFAEQRQRRQKLHANYRIKWRIGLRKKRIEKRNFSEMFESTREILKNR